MDVIARGNTVILIVALMALLKVALSVKKASSIKDFILGKESYKEKHEHIYSGTVDGRFVIRGTRYTSVVSPKYTTFAIVATIFATYVGGDITAGATTKVYDMGMIYMCLVFLIPIYWLIASKVFSKHIRKFHDCYSLGDVMYKLYGGVGAYVSNACSLVMGIGVLGVQCMAFADVCHELFGYSRHWSVIVPMTVVIIYSLSGIRAVMLTDMIQFAFFFLVIFIAVICGLNDVGGINNLIDKLPSTHKELHLHSGNISVFFSIILFRLIPVTYGPFIQRYLMADNRKQLRSTFKSIAYVDFIFSLMIYMIGLIVVVKSPEMTPINAFSYFMHNCVPQVVGTMLVVGMFAIIMSTADSWLHATATLIGYDLTNRWYDNEGRRMRMIKKSTIIIGILSMFFALHMDDIVKTTWMICNIWEPIVLIPLCAGFMGFRTANVTYGISVMGGVLGVVMGYMYAGELGTISVATGVIMNAFVFALTHCLIKKYRPHLMPTRIFTNKLQVIA